MTLDEALKKITALESRQTAQDAEMKEMKEKIEAKKEGEDEDMTRPGPEDKPGNVGSHEGTTGKDKKGRDSAEEEKKMKGEDEQPDNKYAKDKKGRDESSKKVDKEEEKEEKEASKGMDAALVHKAVTDGVRVALADRNEAAALARTLTPWIGVFDHADKSLAEVATYGVQKLGIPSVSKGQELTALRAYLHGRTPDTQGFTVTLDSKANSGDAKLAEYLGA